MGPLAVRFCIEQYLSGNLSLEMLVQDLSQISAKLKADGRRCPPSLYTVLEEATSLLKPNEPDFGWATNEHILKGVCRETLDRLPSIDDTPNLDAVTRIIGSMADAIEQRDGLSLDGIIGSLAQGKADAFSDIDLVAHWTVKPRGFDYFERLTGCLDDLTTQLCRPVDVVFIDDLPVERRAHFVRDFHVVRRSIYVA